MLTFRRLECVAQCLDTESAWAAELMTPLTMSLASAAASPVGGGRLLPLGALTSRSLMFIFAFDVVEWKRVAVHRCLALARGMWLRRIRIFPRGSVSMNTMGV